MRRKTPAFPSGKIEMAVKPHSIQDIEHFQSLLNIMDEAGVRRSL
ncbi:MAG: hypothetical protein R2864_11985 [Syntrophotaleaceae bacterium]